MNTEEFYIELKSLETKFDAMAPELEVTIRDPKLGVEGYVVVWNTGVSVGGELERCGKGGTRITPDLTIDEIKMLARRMALKNAASGLPLGGSKSGLKLNPDAEGFETQYRKFVKLCSPFLFENGGVFGGFGFDIGARSIHPKWACDELNSTRCFTGKPVDMGGTDYDKEGIAGLGVATAAKIAMECDNVAVEGARFSVQGIGAMGAAVVKYFSEYGGKLYAVSDMAIGGTWIFGDDGASDDIVKSISVGDFDKTKELLKLGGYQQTDDVNDALYQDVDLVVPAAVQDVVTMDNVHKIQAKYMSEGANGPCTDDARTKMHEMGITVIPDFIANPGGIIAAYIEMTSKISPEENAKTRENVTRSKDMTRERITENVKKLMKLSHDLNIEPSHAGMYIALQNIFKES